MSAAAVTPGVHVQEAKLTPGNGEWYGDFGEEVAIDGDTAFVGASTRDHADFDAGSAFVYERDGDGIWREEQELSASDGSTGDYFGASVAVDGDTALVGAHYDDTVEYDSTGSVYVFTRGSYGWNEGGKLVPSDGRFLDRFGQEVALDGDVAVVGAPGRGSAYVFEHTANDGWSEVAQLTPGDGTSMTFGWAVAVDGDRVLLGAPLANDDEGATTGAAYLYTRDAAGGWTETAKLNASDGKDGDYLGDAVALSGSTAIVGAPGDGAGSAYVFTESPGGTWTEGTKLVPSDGTAEDRFGSAVALDGDVAVAGAVAADLADAEDAGSVYVHVRDANGVWTQEPRLTSLDPAPGDHLGVDVAVDGATVLAGADDDDNLNGPEAGSAFVFVPAEVQTGPVPGVGR